MRNKMKMILAAIVLSGSMNANVHAATITVKKGDTLSELSRTHQMSVKELKAINQLTSNKIRQGEVLKVNKQKQYIVKKGETLWDIAKQQNVSVTQLKKWNKLKNNIIHPGKKLVIQDVNAKETAKSKGNSVKAAETKTAKKTNQGKAQAQKVITVKATAYTANCKGCTGITKTGVNLKANPSKKIIAVDPSIIPLGSKVYVEGYGKAIAADIGGAIKGKRIDVFIPSQKAAIQYGVKTIKVRIID
jgi:3D (Asp-Asp-Asp) domain-containing protein/LysM repeat protein